MSAPLHKHGNGSERDAGGQALAGGFRIRYARDLRPLAAGSARVALRRFAATLLSRSTGRSAEPPAAHLRPWSHMRIRYRICGMDQ